MGRKKRVFDSGPEDSGIKDSGVMVTDIADFSEPVKKADFVEAREASPKMSIGDAIRYFNDPANLVAISKACAMYGKDYRKVPDSEKPGLVEVAKTIIKR